MKRIYPLGVLIIGVSLFIVGYVATWPSINMLLNMTGWWNIIGLFMALYGTYLYGAGFVLTVIATIALVLDLIDRREAKKRGF